MTVCGDTGEETGAAHTAQKRRRVERRRCARLRSAREIGMRSRLESRLAG